MLDRNQEGGGSSPPSGSPPTDLLCPQEALGLLGRQTDGEWDADMTSADPRVTIVVCGRPGAQTLPCFRGASVPGQAARLAAPARCESCSARSGTAPPDGCCSA